jgi:hypothetical protein
VSETRRPFVERGLRPTGGVALGAGWLEAGREVLRARGRSKAEGRGFGVLMGSRRICVRSVLHRRGRIRRSPVVAQLRLLERLTELVDVGS